MKTIFATAIAVIFLFSNCTTMKKDKTVENPLLNKFETPFEVPPFHLIKAEHFMPAFEIGIKEQKAQIELIINSSDKPTFENTIAAIENSDYKLSRASSIFYNLTSSDLSDELNAISKEIAPIMASHYDDVNLNQALFLKVKEVYENRENLDLSTEELTLTENTYKGFIRGGVNLNTDDKEQFRDINKELSSLYLKFSDNILAENNRYELVIDNQDDLAGLSDGSIAAATSLAQEKGYENKWVFTIKKPSLLPFLENAENRDLRKQMYEAYLLKGDNNDDLDTKIIITEIANLRVKRAKLLGFNNHAEFILDKNMAKKPENVYSLLDQLMKPALIVAQREIADMQAIVDAEGDKFTIQGWDYWYYASKVKAQKYALNENEVRPYLQLKNVVDGMFWVANQMYGITFTQLKDAPIYNPEANVYEVNESNGDHIGVLYLDYHPRASKRSGAWCTSFRSQKYADGKRVAPVMSIVCNFTTPIGDTPALLTIDETETLFHEFGHALDGLFSNKQYSSLRVPRDFVELPSQIMENWAFAPEVLTHYAKHYQTGEIMPQELVDKIKNASKFNQGFATTEYLAASYLDMDWHTITEPVSMNANEFEKESMDKIHLMGAIAPRYRSSYFQHVFSGTSYSSGYYSYVWAEVLDADAFEFFSKNGLFNKEIAKSFRENVLELGGTKDAMESYIDFRGQKPDIKPLIKRRGLDI